MGRSGSDHEQQDKHEYAHRYKYAGQDRGEKQDVPIGTTSVGFGDVDGDGRDELGVAIQADYDSRFWVLDDAKSGYDVLFSGGGGIWFDETDFEIAVSDCECRPNRRCPTAIAFGDVDGDGRDEFGVVRASTLGERFCVYDDAKAGFDQLFEGGREWGPAAATTDIAFGDIDDDGVDELGIARKSGTNMRFLVIEDRNAQFERRLVGGREWGAGTHATGIAFGNIDGEPRAEVGVTRNARSNARFFVFDDEYHGFDRIVTGGRVWAESFAVDIAFGESTGGRDTHGDRQEQLAVARAGADGQTGTVVVGTVEADGFETTTVFLPIA